MAAQKMRAFRAVDPAGKEYEARAVRPFCIKHSLPPNHFYEMLTGSRDSVDGWTARYLDVPAFDDHPEETDDTGIEELGLDIPIEKLGNYTKDQIRTMVRGAILRVTSIQARLDGGGKDRPPGFDSGKTIRSLKELAITFGVDFTDIQDNRSELQRAIDLADNLSRMPQAVFEEADEVLITIEKAIEATIEVGEEYFVERLGAVHKNSEDTGMDPPDPKALWASLEKWLALMRRIRTVRRLAREPTPAEAFSGPEMYPHRFKNERVWEATHALRFMLYVGRSDLKGDVPADLVFKIGKHIVKACIDVWEAWEQVGFTINGILKPGEYEFEDDDFPYEGVPYEGVQIMQPPRHSKTSFIRHWLALRIDMDNRTKAAYTHCRGEEARAFLSHVGSVFDLETSTGNRNYVLFPFRLAEFDNKLNKLRLHNRDPMNAPNLVAAGLTEAAQGKDLNILIGDDLVPQSDQTEIEMRKKHIALWKGTWMTRLEESVGEKTRGGFFILSGYPWHHEDLMWTEAKRAALAARTRGTQGVVCRLSVQPVGGPPKFTPIWKRVWPASALKRKYKAVGSVIYSANYQLNPNTDEMRIVRRVALYDMDDPMHLDQFVQEAEMQLSIDPSATAHTKSDKAGLVSLGVGEVSSVHKDAMGAHIEKRRMRVRVYSAREFHAGQADMAETIAEITRARDISVVYIEIAVGLGGPIRDHLENYHGLANIVECRTHNRNKGQRLMAVASMLEDSNPEFSPIVEFPGRKDDSGELMIVDEGIKQLVNYIVNFRTTAGHHTLDALTQALAKLSPQLGTLSTNKDSRSYNFDEQVSRKVRHLREVGRKKMPASDMDAVAGMMDFCRGGVS